MATRLPNGRRLQVQCYGFSPVGQLLQATTPTLSETFAFGRRVAKRVACPGQPERTTLFVWDGDTLLQEIDAQRTVTYVYEPQSFVPLARVQSTESLAHYPPDSVAIATVHDWAPPRLGDVSPDAPHDAHLGAWQHHLRWQQALLDEARAQAAYDTHSASAHAVDICHLYECDHLGTPQMLLDDQGRTAWSAHYRAWGRIERLEVNDIDQPLRFQGQYEDAETGLYYNRHRYYDPEAGRYVTQDPIGLIGGVNLYSYVASPTTWIDPVGLSPQSPARLLKNISELRAGKDVTVCSYKEADAVLYGAFPDAQKVAGAGEKSAEKLAIDKAKFKELRQLGNGKATFHKDYKMISGTNVLFGHESLPEGHPHKHVPHINVITPEGNKATIYVEKACRRK